MRLQNKWLGSSISYQNALDTQLETLTKVLEGTAPDTYLTLEHSPIYTIGRTRDKSSLLNPELLPHPQVEINRGGQATYHGPGQLIGYPIINLRNLGKDLHTFIRAIESALVSTCQDFGVDATIRDGLTGIWVEKRKLASIGVGVKKWVSMHGYAINITKESLTGFNYIIPCGLQGISMTTVAQEANKDITVQEFAETTTKHLEAEFTKLMQQNTI